MSKKVKIVLAAVLGVFAVFVILWNSGMFDRTPAPPKDPFAGYTPEQKTEMQKEQQQHQTQIQKKSPPPSGA
jgi:hypothetical protein